MGDQDTQPVPKMDAWPERFYVTTYNDAEAIVQPHLSPRQARRHGPFNTYGEAVGEGMAQANVTHFRVDKMYVNPGVFPMVRT